MATSASTSRVDARPDPRPGSALSGPRPVECLRSGLLAGLWAAVAGLSAVGALTVLAWLTAPDAGTSTTEAVRTGVRLWLLGHGVPLTTRAGDLEVVPLGLTLVAAALVAVIALRAARESLPRRPPLRMFSVHLAGLCTGYAATALLAQLWAGDADLSKSVAAASGATILAFFAGGAGAARGLWGAGGVRSAVPAWAARAGRGTAMALGLLLATGLVLVVLTVAVNFSSVMASTDRLDAGSAGNALLLVAQAAYLPVFVVWAGSVAAGPGFALGSGAVTVLGSSVAEPPAVPLLAAIPAELPWWTLFLLLVPVSAGAVAGWRTSEGCNGRSALASGAGMSVATGAGWLLLCAAASGSLASGFYDAAGPAPWTTGLVVTGEVAAGAAAAWYLRYGPPVLPLMSRMMRRSTGPDV